MPNFKHIFRADIVENLEKKITIEKHVSQWVR